MVVVEEDPPVAGTENWHIPLNAFLNAINARFIVSDNQGKF